MEKLSEKDVPKFLECGEMTKPFLKDELVLDMVLRDYKARLKGGKNASFLASLYNWIASKVEYSKDEDFKSKYKFNRNAEEIWKSKLCTGCTDYALLFSTFARQIGIPTTILHSAQEKWVKDLQEGERFDVYKGHTFCECYYEGKWVLVDPTAKKVLTRYNPNKIELDYSLDGEKVFISYCRDVDLGGKRGLKEHNLDMEEKCKYLMIHKNNIQIVEAEERHYEEIKDLLVQLQEYIVEIDKYKLNILAKEYREGYFKKTINESLGGGGVIFVAENNGEVIGMIAGHIRKYDEEDKLDFTCPQMGIIEELIVKKGLQNGGTGKQLVEKMEKYFADKNCEFIELDVFAYNQNAYEFYLKSGYENRLLTLIKKL